MSHPLRPDTKHRGFNLIEAAIVLGVVGLVIGGIWVAAASVMEKRRQDRCLEQILEITQNIRRVFAGVRFSGEIVFSTSGSPNAIPKDSWPPYIPSDMIRNSDTPENPWGYGNSISVKPDRISFNILLTSVSTCAVLGPRIYAAIKNQIPPDTLAGTEIITGAGGLDISTPALAAANCQTDFDNEGSISIVFYINR